MRLPVTTTAEDHRRGGWGGGDGGGDDGDEPTGEEAGAWALALEVAGSLGAPTSSWYRACPVHPVSSLGAVDRGHVPKGASREYLRCTGVRARGAALVMRQNYGGGMASDWSTPPGRALSIPAKNRVWNCAAVNESLSVRKVGGAHPLARGVIDCTAGGGTKVLGSVIKTLPL